MKRQELYELMNGCRPDLSDLTEEEARALAEAFEQDAQLRVEFQARQSWDVAIGRAMHDVPVPEGLAQRLVDALAADSPAQPVVRRRAPRSTRRDPFSTLLSPLSAALVAAAAIVLCALWFVLAQRDNLTAVQVAEDCRMWIGQLDQEAWRSAEAPVDQYPLDPGLRLHVVGWQPRSNLAYGQAVVYWAELPPARTNAYLFVIRTDQGRHLPTIPPNRPDSTTDDLCIGVWKSGNCLFVLVVPGSQRHYLNALRTDNVG